MNVWTDPDWYDAHDAAWTAGVDRDPEQLRELVLSLPPLGPDDVLVDVGCGTGKASLAIAQAYPRLGAVHLLEPLEPLLARAHTKLTRALPDATLHTSTQPVGHDAPDLPRGASLVVAADALLFSTEARGGTLAQGLEFALGALEELHDMLRPGGTLRILDTVSPSWDTLDLDAPFRRPTTLALCDLLDDAGFQDVEVVYRFRDRLVLSALAPSPE